MGLAVEARPKVEFALDYARLGYRVFPCHWIYPDGKCSCRKPDCGSPGKHPIEKGWQESATTDEKKIRWWWSRNSQANIGIACGKDSNLTVLDVDIKRHNGRDTLHDLEAEHGELPASPTVITGSGGEHRYFQFEPGIHNAVEFLPGLDTRSEGGFVVGVGSQTQKGEYRWEVGSPGLREGPPRMPAWLAEQIKAASHSNGAGVKLPDKIFEHEGRNNELHRVGRSLKARKLPESAIRAALLEANRTVCRPPLESSEINKLISNIIKQPDSAAFKAATEQEPNTGDQRQAGPYVASPRGLFVEDRRADLIKLANFWSCIVRNLRRDDGLEVAHEYEIACHRGDELAIVSVPVNKFASMAWVPEKLPPRFIPCAGSKVKDQVRESTQLFSDFDIPESVVYTAPGWRKFGEQDGYVHGGGVIGVPGDFRIELPSDLAPFELPDAPSCEELIEAVRAALELLRFGPERLAGPLFCVPFRAVLKPADFVVWVYGETGAFKTERAALVMQHVGAGFTSKRIYASLHADSVAALREKIFLIKDAPCLCDDYRPGLTGIERSTQQQNLDLIMRAAGNSAGRSTVTTDRRLVSGRPPRCLPILTAEDLPYGESTKGRGLLLQVRHGDFLKETLSKHQSTAAKGIFAAATAGFLTWLAPKLKSVLEQWEIKFVELRNRAAEGHARTPGIIADLYMAGELFVEFAIEIHAITPDEGVVALNTIWTGLVEASAEQAALQNSDKPEVRFIELLQSSISSGHSHLADRNGGEPSEPASWGWRFYPLVKPEDVERGGDDVADAQKRMWRFLGDRIGWVDLEKGEVYLDPVASHRAAAAMVGDGDAFTASVTMLAKRMDDAGLLIRTEKKSGLKRKSLRCRETLQGVQRDVLVVAVATLQPEIEDE